MRAIFLGGLGLGVLLNAARAGAAAPAYLGLTAQSADTRIYEGGGLEPISAFVYNQASAGSNALNYTLQYTFPDSSTSTFFNQTRIADGGTGYDGYTLKWNTAGYAPGTYRTLVSASDPNALNSPQSVNVDVTVVQHGKVVVYNGNAAVEPSVEPLAFGATGGGETFAAKSTAVGDPVGPAGTLDIDSIAGIGDPQITTTLTPMNGLIDDNNVADGDPFLIDVDGSVVGSYSKTFYIYYSDEQDIPGAFAPGSEVYAFAVSATVADIGGVRTVTGTIAEVPEPACAGALLVGAAVLGLRRPAHRGGLRGESH